MPGHDHSSSLLIGGNSTWICGIVSNVTPKTHLTPVCAKSVNPTTRKSTKKWSKGTVQRPTLSVALARKNSNLIKSLGLIAVSTASVKNA